VKALSHILRFGALATVLNCLASPVVAGPLIEVSFEADAADRQKLVHAQAVFQSSQSTVYNIFNDITGYPQLHDWIRETTRLGTGKDSQVYLVKFAFPWPVGREWSRVEVHRSGNTIYWEQLDGTLKANHGRISFTSSDGDVHIDYRAAIDIGLPESWTQSYKEKFIREFLTAACERAQTATTPAATLLLANRP
jgi:uncharacterized membrane protein